MTKKVLVVIDVQNDFVDGSLGSKEALETIPNIVERIKKADYDCILFTKDTHFDNYLETAEGKKLPVKHCIVGTPGHDLYPAVMAAIGEVEETHHNIEHEIFEKCTFGSVELVDYLCKYAIDKLDTTLGSEDKLDVEFVGFCTDICVVSNVLNLKASLYETANISVNEKCCAGVTPETHAAAITTMKMCQIDIV